MSIAILFLLALALSMDAFAVSISNGMCYRNIGKKEAAFTALTFGIFQGLMPVVGYFGGKVAERFISSLDHWIAFFLLGFIGVSMIVESVKEMRAQGNCRMEKNLGIRDLLVQGIATSIDALAVGISFAALKINIAVAAGFIALVTFVVCLFGALLGKRFGVLLGQKAKVCGGLLLLAIGIKIWMEHMFG